MIEIRITRQNRLEPTLILQSVNDVTNCKRETLFSVFINYTQLTLIQRRLNPGIKKIHGIRDQVLQQFWDQGSKFKAQMWDQSAKNIPCYDPEIRWKKEEVGGGGVNLRQRIPRSIKNLVCDILLRFSQTCEL